MMRKLFFIYAAVCTAVLFTGCGDSEFGSVSESFTGSSGSSSQAEEEEIPTDRIRDIESAADFEYEMIGDNAVITRYTGSGGIVEIPETIGDKPVAEIGYYAFEAKYGVTAVILPETVNSISEGAFMDCSGLESINLPESVTSIGRGAFVSCTSLRELTIPAAVEYIHEEAFTGCEGMTALTIKNPDLEYENWGLEELPDLTVIAPEDSAVFKWAAEKGLSVSPMEDL